MACGQTAQTGVAGADAGAQAGAVRKALAPAKIAFFTNWGAQHHVNGQQKVLDLFQQENPGVTVEMTTGAAKADKIASSIAARAAPDLVSQNPGLLIPLAMKNTWRALEDYVKTGLIVKRETYADAQLKLSSWKGKLYGVPAFYRQARGPQIAEFRKTNEMWTSPKAGIVVGTQSMQLTG